MEESNIKAMREALEVAEYVLCAKGLFDDSKQMAAALSTPPRNCDVGTPEEQFKRFNMFCFPIKCRECKLYTEEDLYDCIFRWLQLPYEEGDNE